jgi:hypothetical protein
MIGQGAVSELPIGAADPAAAPSVDVTGVGWALSQSSVFGVPGLDAPVSGVVVATSTAVGSLGADIAKVAAASSVTSARAIGRVDRELKLVGVANVGTFATAIIRAEGPAIVARAQTRVLPLVEATSEVLPLVTVALASVRADRVARTVALPLTSSGTADLLEDPHASARVSD